MEIDDLVELPRRNVLGSVTTTDIASAGVGTATATGLSDEETGEGNTVTAETLNLEPSGESLETVDVDQMRQGH